MNERPERRHAAAPVFAVLATALLTQACGLQATGGVRSTDDPRRTRGSLELSGRLHRARPSGPYGAWSSSFVFADAQPMTLRSLAFGVGYRVVAAEWLRFELGPELGFGIPTTRYYSDTALFTGGVGGVLVRIPVLGDQDNMVGFAPFGTMLDAVVLGRGGRWTPAVADRASGTWEVGVELGLRFTVFSDLVVATHDSWEDPWDER